MKYLLATIFAGVIAISLAACSAPKTKAKTSPKPPIGLLSGDTLGSLYDDETDELLDDSDKAVMTTITRRSLNDNKPYTWKNPESGRSGEILPTDSYIRAGRQCLEFEQSVFLSNRRETAEGTACRQADGKWRIFP